MLHTIPLGIVSSTAAAYLLEQSLLFDGAAYLNRTPSTAGNRKTWTYSVWVKYMNDGTNAGLLNASNNDATSMWGLRFSSTDGGTLNYLAYPGSIDAQVRTNAVFRDSSAWYHIVCAVDTTQATASNRVKLYVNGSLETDLAASTYPSLNYDDQINNTVAHTIGYVPWATQYYTGLMALPQLVDGAALAPTAFGETDGDGFWNPIEYTGVETPASAAITYSLTDSGVSGSSAVTNTYSTKSIGTADAGRTVIVGVSSNGTNIVTGMTIGGVSATELTVFTGTNNTGSIWAAAVPSGTTADIVITNAGGGAATGIAVYRALNVGSLTAYTAGGSAVADPMTATVFAPAGSAIFAAGGGYSPASFTWTGVTEDTDLGAVASGEDKATHGSIAIATDQSVDVGCDPSSGMSEGSMAAVVLTGTSFVAGGYGTNGGAYNFADTTSFGLDVSNSLVTSQDAYNISGLHFDGANASTTFTDETGRTWTQGGSAIISTTQSKFGGSSLYLGDNTEKWYVDTADSTELDFAGDFTVESWLYFNEFGADATSVGSAWFTKAGGSRTSTGSASGSTGYCCVFGNNPSNTRLNFYMNANTGVNFTFTALSLNTWYHFALTRNGNNWYLFIDGVQVGGTQTNSTVPTTNTDPFDIGRGATYSGGNWYYPGNYTLSGYVDDFQISNFAKYTSGFTPLTRAFYSNNTFGPNNFTTSDQLEDSPTSSSDDGIGNFATWNALKNDQVVLSEGNLNTVGQTAMGNILSTIPITAGMKIAFEVEIVASDTNVYIGMWKGSKADTTFPPTYGLDGDSWSIIHSAGGNSGIECKYNSIRDYFYTASGDMAAGDKFHIEIDKDAGEVFVWINDGGGYVAFNSGLTVFDATAEAAIVAEDNLFIAHSIYQTAGTNSVRCNFGQKAFDKTPTAGYTGLATQNLPAPTIADGSQHFNTVLWTGDGTSPRKITTGFAPDLIWIKNRTDAVGHQLFDTLRDSGTEPYLLASDSTAAETVTGRYLANLASNAFDTDGFNLSSTGNVSAKEYVAWCWKAGGSASSNTDGSITSSVSANTTSGFSIISYTGTGASYATPTIGHGLGSAPKFYIIKNRGQTDGWAAFHDNMDTSNPWNDRHLRLDTNAAVSGALHVSGAAPTSSIIYLDSDHIVNASSEAYICYAWSEVEGFSKFGSYTGNANVDGPFIYLGFRPAFILEKRTDAAGAWYITDMTRDTYNPVNKYLMPDVANAEASGSTSSGVYLDALSNGYKIRGTGAGQEYNRSGGTYIYAAFAEHPFQGADGVTQARAR